MECAAHPGPFDGSASPPEFPGALYHVTARGNDLSLERRLPQDPLAERQITAVVERLREAKSGFLD